jgi:hypothetical protein
MSNVHNSVWCGEHRSRSLEMRIRRVACQPCLVGRGQESQIVGNGRIRMTMVQGRARMVGEMMKCLLGVYNSSTSLIKTQPECELLV